MVTAISAGTNPKTLYFDLDGTLLHDSQPKQALAGRAFERAVRDAGVERMVCVGSEKEGLGPVYHRQSGGRIFAPAAEGDGMDVLDWLRTRVK